MQRSLTDWVEYIQTLHHRQIDLGLGRVAAVYARLVPDGLKFPVISIAGTNGKGSTAELTASIYRAAGYHVGKYTSPHLVEFNERIEIAGNPVDDAALLAAFERIEALRGDIPITYFEFATLVAIDLFIEANIDVAIMEVGLGGRLDAVNILDADVAIITSLSIDHTAWLGSSVEQIAVEKAGIARAGKPCVVGMSKPPHSLLGTCREVGAEVHLIGDAFTFDQNSDETVWHFKSSERQLENLPLPFKQAGVQLTNAAVAIHASIQLHDVLPITDKSIKAGLRNAKVLGRCQILKRKPITVLDVAHNQASVNQLMEFVSGLEVSGKIYAACGMLKDKEIGKSFAEISTIVDHWYLASIANDRGASSQELKSILLNDDLAPAGSVTCFDTITDAVQAAQKTLTAHDCLVVFGSFYIVGDILRVHAQTAVDDSHY